MSDDDLEGFDGPAIAEALSRCRHPAVDGDVLVGFVVVCEFVDASGQRRLARFSADGTGNERGLASWTRDGMLRAATAPGWYAIGRDDEDDADGDDAAE